MAGQGGADAVVFPELTIPGYLSQDLIYDRGYVDRNLEVLDAICQLSTRYPGLNIVVGYIARNDGPGKPFCNMAGVICNGEVSRCCIDLGKADFHIISARSSS